MLKNFIVFLSVAFISSCSFWRSGEYNMCPRVQISRDNSYLTQVVNYKEQFQISLIGFEGFCYFDSKVNQQKARVSALFEIKRLRPSDENAVDFAYYTSSVKGPKEFLGKKTYYEHVEIPADKKLVEYKSQPVDIRIPENMKYSFDIYLGMVISPEEYKYNKRTFDINYKYYNH